MKKKALVVDDDDLVRRILPALLEAHRYDAESTDSAEKALAIIAQRRFDLIITDYEMSGMNGIELVRVVRETSPHSFVILMTGRVATEVFRTSFADAFLQKPFTTDTLREVLDIAGRRAAELAARRSARD